jgi:inner membrane protein
MWSRSCGGCRTGVKGLIASYAPVQSSDCFLVGRPTSLGTTRSSLGCLRRSSARSRGLSLLAGVDAYGQWHHVLTHGVIGAALVAVFTARLAKDRLPVSLMALTAFHLHLLCDFFGSGHGWGLTYWYPFSTRECISPIQWDLNAWSNVLATALALGMSGWLAVRHGHSVAETILPARWDAVIVETLKNRFGNTHRLRPTTGC